MPTRPSNAKVTIHWINVEKNHMTGPTNVTKELKHVSSRGMLTCTLSTLCTLITLSRIASCVSYIFPVPILQIQTLLNSRYRMEKLFSAPWFLSSAFAALYPERTDVYVCIINELLDRAQVRPHMNYARGVSANLCSARSHVPLHYIGAPEAATRETFLWGSRRHVAKQSEFNLKCCDNVYQSSHTLPL